MWQARRAAAASSPLSPPAWRRSDMADDVYHLARFLDAQESVYGQALAELQAGRKRSHWMWFIFPQLRGLGRSPTAAHFGIGSLAEAEGYLAHPPPRPPLRPAPPPGPRH